MSGAPIKLDDYDFHGFAMHGAMPGQDVDVLHKAMLTSDSPDFHVFMRGLGASLIGPGRDASAFQPEHASHLLLVIHAGRTAELHLNNFEMRLEMMAKKDVAAGQVVSEADIADVRRLRLHGVKLEPDDKVLVCFKVNWKFGLHFDLGIGEKLDVDALERELGHLYRVLRFEAAYDALGDERGDSVAAIKIILTEIKGVLRGAHVAEKGVSVKTGKLLEFAAQRGVRKSESDASLFFPAQFLRYLNTSTFANFDPNQPGDDASRHSVGHGAAKASAYTQRRALQAILTLDQIARYL